MAIEKKHHAHRVDNITWTYRGFKIRQYPNEGLAYHRYHYVYEAYDEYGCVFAHSVTLSATKREIDEHLDKKNTTL